MAGQKRCFVIMGFGKKTDYTTGRTLDLDKSYKYLIKPVVEAKGWACIRADEIPHSGVIDLQMYHELLHADVVIADLSTTNANAIYELGIRHALRPFTTIMIAENKLAVYPFDINHVNITTYEHTGDSIDYGEVERFRKVLSKLLDTIIKQEPPKKDSPVYTFISDLVPPSIQKQIDEAVSHSKDIAEVNVTAKEPAAQTLAVFCSEGELALKNKQFYKAKKLFSKALILAKAGNKKKAYIDPYLIHRLALGTYKAGKPDAITALKDALKLLSQLDLGHTNDPETVALAGSIEKKLYEKGQGDEHLKNAILYNERGYFLLNNRYNGINLAYTFNCRVDSKLYDKKEDKIADMVFANRVRARVLMICDRDWAELAKREGDETVKISTASAEEIQKQKDYNNEQKFWILVNKAEAHFGLGDFQAYKKAVAQAKNIPHAEWMMQSFQEQVDKLHVLLDKYGNLLETPWIYREA